MRTAIDQLTISQRQALASHVNAWKTDVLSTKPADRDGAEHCVRRLYAQADLPPPRRIVWTQGPFELGLTNITECRFGRFAGAGDAVTSRIIDDAICAAAYRWPNLLSKSVAVELAAALPRELRNIKRTVMQILEPGWPLTGGRFAALLKGRWRQPALYELKNTVWGQFDGPALWGFGVMHDVLGFESELAPLEPISALAKSIGWIAPFANVCWLSERAETIAIDATGRFHCASRPALSFRDGWKYYAWKGVEVPSWVIERPDKITPTRIARQSDPRVRRCMIDIMTPERYIADGGATCVARDSFGILWRKQWRFDSWAAVEVINGSPEPDGSYKHYFLTVPDGLPTPVDAVAWTYGLDTATYRQLHKRT